MGNFSKSAGGTAHGNTVVLYKVKVCFQVFPGVAGTDAQRGIAGIPYTVEVVDNSGIGLISTGSTARDGGVELHLGTGESAILTIFETNYLITVTRGIMGVEMVSGVRERLRYLGYFLNNAGAAAPVDDELKLALLNFQADSNLDADGEFRTDDLGNTFVNRNTRDQLKKDFGM